MKQALPLRRTLWGWRGVRVGEASNPGPVEARSARRSAAAGDWDDESGSLAVAEAAQTNGECSRRAVRADSVRRPKRLRIQMRQPSLHNDVPASILALEADLQTIPASTVPASSRALAFHDDAFVASAASTVPASSAAVRGMHVVPVVSMSEGSERASDNHSDGEAPMAPAMTLRVSDVNLISKASSHQRGQRCLWKSLSSVLLPAHEVS